MTYSLEKPVEPVDTATITSTMDEIIAQDAFTSSGGNLVSKRAPVSWNEMLRKSTCRPKRLENLACHKPLVALMQ